MADPFGNPFGSGQSVLPGFGDSNLGFGGSGGTRRRSQSAIPKIEQGEADSMLLDIARTTLSGVELAGNILDTPGAIVRGLLAGENPLPGIMSPDKRTSGRDLLEQYGMLDANEEGLDWGDGAGFIAEMALDPLMLVNGPARALVKGNVKAMQIAEAAGKSLGGSPSRYADEILEGSRGIASLRIPGMEKPFAVMGAKSPTAAKAADYLYHNPISASFRKYFDNRVLGIDGVAGQRAADEAFDFVADTAILSHKRKSEIYDILEGHDKSSWDNVVAWGEDNQEFVKEILGPNVKISQMGDHVSGPEQLIRALGDSKELAAKQTASPITDGVTQMMATRNYRELSGRIMDSDTVPEALKTFEKLAHTLSVDKDKAFNALVERGYNIKALTDKYAEHMPRNIEKELHRVFGSAKDRVASFGNAKERSKVLKDIPGSTLTVNRMSRDPNLVGPDRLSEMAHDSIDNFRNIGGENYGEDDAFDYIMKTYGIDDNVKAQELADFMGALPEETIAKGGLFNRGVVHDTLEYIQRATEIRHGMDAVYGLIERTALPTGGGADAFAPTVLSVLNGELGLTKKSGEYLAAKWKTKGGVEGLENMRLPAEFADTAKKLFGFHKDPETAKGILGLYDKFLSQWKASVYTMWPASHSRNLVSGLWQNMVTAFTNPASAMRAGKETFEMMHGKSSKWVREMDDFNVLGGIRLRDYQGQQGGKSTVLRKTIGDPFKESWHASKKNALVSLFSPESPWNPTNFPGVRKALDGRKATFFAGAFGEDLSETIEAFNRASHYIARRNSGWTPDAAARSVKMAHFDYGALSDFERRVMKRTIPFYTFTRNNVPYQLKQLINSPGGRTAQTVRGLNRVQDEAGQEPLMPEWIKERISMPIGPGKTGDSKQYLMLNKFLPVEEALGWFPAKNGSFSPLRATEKLAGNTALPIQFGLEQLIGKQLWSGRPLDELKQWPFGEEEGTLADLGGWNQQANALTSMGPLGRGIAVGRGLVDDRKSVEQKALNTLISGIGITDVDSERQMRYEAKRVVEDLIREMPESREHSQQYIRKEDQKGLPEDRLKLMSLYYFLLNQGKAEGKKKK